MKTIYGYHCAIMENNDPANVIEQIDDYCAEAGLVLGDFYIDLQADSMKDRPEYLYMRDKLQQGDCLIIESLESVFYSEAEALEEIGFLCEKGVALTILDIPETRIDFCKHDERLGQLIANYVTRCIYGMLMNFQKEDKPAQSGGGRPKAVDLDAFEEVYRKVLDGSISAFECMKELGISRSTYYRYREEYERMRSSDVEEENK